MARRGLIEVPPSGLDLMVAKAAARVARPWLEREARLLTWLADGEVLGAAAAAIWLGTRAVGGTLARRRADHLVVTALAANAVPHLGKHLVRQERPDRMVAPHPREGVPRSGRPYDAFPSGHAVHLGAWASALSRWAPPRWHWAPWAAAALLGGTRILLLAHWASDVALGLGSGIALERGLRRLTGEA